MTIGTVYLVRGDITQPTAFLFHLFAPVQMKFLSNARHSETVIFKERFHKKLRIIQFRPPRIYVRKCGMF